MSSSTPEAMTFLRHQAQSGTGAWSGLCLKLQRTARDLPGVYPSAITAAMATPDSHRFSEKEAKRGMVAYFDSASAVHGHITHIAGRNSDGELMHWSSDIKSNGGVAMVSHSFFSSNWGQHFLFAADWLNGFALDLPEKKPPKDPTPLNKGQRLRKAISLLNHSIEYHTAHDHPALVKALKRDRDRMKATLKRFGD